VTQTCERPSPGEGDGPGISSCLENIDSSENSQIERPAQAEILRNPRAVREAKLELLREAIFENLGAVSLFAETAKLLIEARDDAGMAHSVKMGAHHFRAAAATVNELSKLKAEGP
jgi:hypothetical protein